MQNIASNLDQSTESSNVIIIQEANNMKNSIIYASSSSLSLHTCFTVVACSLFSSLSFLDWCRVYISYMKHITNRAKITIEARRVPSCKPPLDFFLVKKSPKVAPKGRVSTKATQNKNTCVMTKKRKKRK